MQLAPFSLFVFCYCGLLFVCSSVCVFTFVFVGCVACVVVSSDSFCLFHFDVRCRSYCRYRWCPLSLAKKMPPLPLLSGHVRTHSCVYCVCPSVSV